MNEAQIQKLRDNPKDGFKIQQGDVIIRKVDVNVNTMELVDTNVLVPSTNPHTVVGGKIFRDKESSATFLYVEKQAQFKHKEHKNFKTKVGAGTYFVEPSVEIDMLSDMVKPVVD